MIEPRDALAALREAWHEEDQAEAQMSVADYDGEKRTAERRLTAARAAAREAEAAVGVHLGDEGLDVERLARALVNIRPYGGNPDAWALIAARAVAAEYRRLSEGDSR